MIDWPDAIGHLVRVKRLAEEYDRAGLARFAAPRLPADPEQLRSAIDRRAGALDHQYVEFLRHADGWPGLLHSFGLFGTSELLGEEFDGALELISYLEPDILPNAG